MTASASPTQGYRPITRRVGISGGEPIIRGTRITVRHIVACVQAGQTVDDILDGAPHLTAAQIHAALSYYYDHQSEIDALIEESRPERVAASLGMRIEPVTDGGAIVRRSAD